MPAKAILEKVDGEIIVNGKVVANRRFGNNQVVHEGVTYEILKIKRPDLADPDSSDAKVRLIVKEA